jgi:hypothetical protein
MVGPNTHKLRHLVRFSQKAVENYTAEVKTLSADLASLHAPQAAQVKKSLEELLKQVTDFRGGVLAIQEVMPVQQTDKPLFAAVRMSWRSRQGRLWSSKIGDFSLV